MDTLIHRAYHISSNFLLFHRELEYLKTFFINNAFPLQLFCKRIHSFLENVYRPPTLIPTVPKDIRYFTLPFLGPLNRSFAKNLRSLLTVSYPSIDFKLIFTNSRKIGSFFRLKDDTPHELRSSVVYSFTCPRCNHGTYVGSTTHTIHARACGHLGVSYRTLLLISSPEASPIREHAHNCHYRPSSSDLKILYSHPNEHSLRLAESLLIKTTLPNLNSDSSAAPLFIA